MVTCNGLLKWLSYMNDLWPHVDTQNELETLVDAITKITNIYIDHCVVFSQMV